MATEGGSGEAVTTAASADPNSLGTYPAEGSQAHTYQYYPSATGSYPLATGSTAASWPVHGADSLNTGNAAPQNLSYQYSQQQTWSVQDGTDTSSHSSTPVASGTDNASHAYTSYATYPTSTNQYGYGTSEYTNYYNNYQQQSSQPYSQDVGAYQNSGSHYQPISSFQNTGSYASGPTSYSSTYYNPGDYQTNGAQTGSGYNSQSNAWSQGNYANYTQQYANYNQETNSAYSSSNAAATTNDQQQYKQWADYYSSQTEVTCAPGTENTTVTNTAALPCPVPGVSNGYATPVSQPQPSYAPAWKPEPSPTVLPPVQTSNTVGAYDDYWKHATQTFQNQHASSVQSSFQKPLDVNPSYPSVQDQQQAQLPQVPSAQYTGVHQVQQTPQVPHAQYTGVHQVQQTPHVPNAQYTGVHQVQQTPLPQVTNAQYTGVHQVQQTYQQPLPPPPPLPTDMNRVSKLQIPANPRIASNLGLGLPKTSKDTSASTLTAKPAYVTVSLAKQNDKVFSSNSSDSNLKTGMFPPSLRSYVERALARCKDDKQRVACQEVMKEMITKATADGTLHSRDWDTEPLFPLPDTGAVNDVQSVASVSSFSTFRRSPSRRTKSRWEPLPEEKPIEKPTSTYQDPTKHGGWGHFNGRDRKFIGGKPESKDAIISKYITVDQGSANRSAHRPTKRQRFGNESSATENGDASSDSDKEQGLTAYYSGAIALANSPEERKRRESRSKRFDKGNGQRPENHYRPKKAGVGNLYAKRATAIALSRTFEDGGSRAVEDIDWDALTVKGTCQEIEKRYLRLTSAPDPSTVRPEEVLEKALNMVHNSPKNYLYKCDQLKSIRQDLTVQRIRNELTVKVYETHARLALEFGDLPEFNQCQSQLNSLYADGIAGCHLEFSAYNLLSVILHSHNRRELLSLMSRLSGEAKNHEAVRHALSVRAAVTSGNFVLFFRLYKAAPNLNTCIMDLYVEKIRFEAVKCMSRAFRPTIPVSHIAQVLGFSSAPEGEGGEKDVDGGEEKDVDGWEECTEWLKAHGACLIADSNGEMLVDAKATSSSLFMPEPEDAVAHGDANLAVNDFFTRAST